MNNKTKIIAFLIFVIVITLSIFNIKNPENTKFYLFTTKTEKLSLGNLITLSFISGFTFSSTLTLISKKNSKELLEDNFITNEDFDNYEENNFSQKFKTDRPPERDIRESQPTISVNYRFVDQDNDSNTKNTKKRINNLANDQNDWLNSENEW